MRILETFRDIEYASKSKGTVFCKPCNSEYYIGAAFYPNNYIRHTYTATHRENGGIPLVIKYVPALADIRRHGGLQSSSHTSFERAMGEVSKKLGPAPRARKTRYRHQRTRSVDLVQDVDTPAVPNLHCPQEVPLPADTSSTSTTAVTVPISAGFWPDAGSSASNDIWRWFDGSGVHSMTILIKLPDGMPCPTQLDLQGSVKF